MQSLPVLPDLFLPFKVLAGREQQSCRRALARPAMPRPGGPQGSGVVWENGVYPASDTVHRIYPFGERAMPTKRAPEKIACRHCLKEVTPQVLSRHERLCPLGPGPLVSGVELSARDEIGGLFVRWIQAGDELQRERERDLELLLGRALLRRSIETSVPLDVRQTDFAESGRTPTSTGTVCRSDSASIHRKSQARLTMERAVPLAA